MRRTCYKKGSHKEPSGLKFINKQHCEAYQALSKIKIKPLRFICQATFLSLGVMNGVTTLFKNISWQNFPFLYTKIFERPTCKFLTSFSRDNEEKVTHFQILGQSFNVSFENVNKIMRTPRHGTHYCTMTYPCEFQEDAFWDQIMEEISFTLGWDRGNHIIRSFLQLAHHIFLLDIYLLRGHPNYKNLLFILWCMTREDGPHHIFLSYFFQKCFETRVRPICDIYINGMITIFANDLS